MIDETRCKCSFHTIAPINFMLRQHDAVDHISSLLLSFLGYTKLHFLATILFAYLYKITNSANVILTNKGLFTTTNKRYLFLSPY